MQTLNNYMRHDGLWNIVNIQNIIQHDSHQVNNAVSDSGNIENTRKCLLNYMRF